MIPPITQNSPIRKASVVTVSSVRWRKRMPTMTETRPSRAMSHRVPAVSSWSAMAITIRNRPATKSQIPKTMAKA